MFWAHIIPNACMFRRYILSLLSLSPSNPWKSTIGPAQIIYPSHWGRWSHVTDHKPTSTPRQGEALPQGEKLGLTARKKECWAGRNKVIYLVKTNRFRTLVLLLISVYKLGCHWMHLLIYKVGLVLTMQSGSRIRNKLQEPSTMPGTQ